MKHKQGKDAIFHLSKVPLRSKTSIETTPGRGLWNNKFHYELKSMYKIIITSHCEKRQQYACIVTWMSAAAERPAPAVAPM